MLLLLPGAEIAYSPASANSIEECLLWNHCEVYGIRLRSKPTLYAKFTYHWMKAQRKDPPKFKTIPLWVLPPHMTTQDPLRQMMVLGIMDGALGYPGLTWTDLEGMVPIEEDVRIKIPMYAPSLLLPVLRSVQKGSVSPEPLESRMRTHFAHSQSTIYTVISN